MAPGDIGSPFAYAPVQDERSTVNCGCNIVMAIGSGTGATFTAAE